MLTPLFRRFLFVGLPVALIGGSGSPTSPIRRGATPWARGSPRSARAIEQRPEFIIKLMAIDGASPEVAAMIRATAPSSCRSAPSSSTSPAIRSRDPGRSTRSPSVDVRVLVGRCARGPTRSSGCRSWSGARRRGLELLDHEGRARRRDRQPAAPAGPAADRRGRRRPGRARGAGARGGGRAGEERLRGLRPRRRAALGRRARPRPGGPAARDRRRGGAGAGDGAQRRARPARARRRRRRHARLRSGRRCG